MIATAMALVALKTLPQAFQTYTDIPAPMAAPEGSVSQKADYLAKIIAEHQPQAGPAIVTALQLCGFSIIKPDKTVIYAPTKEANNGMAFDDYEVIALCNSGPTDPGLTFGSISEVFSGAPHAPSQKEVNDNLIACLRDGVRSKHPGVSFLSSFFDDLSQYGAQPWSLNQSSNSLMGVGIPPQAKSQFAATEMGAGQPGDAVTTLSSWATQEMASVSQAMSQGMSNPAAMKDVMAKMAPVEQIMMETQKAKTDAIMMQTGQNSNKNPIQYGDNPVSVLQYELVWRKLYGEMYTAQTAFLTKAAQRVRGPAVADPPPDYSGTWTDAAANGLSNMYSKMWSAVEGAETATDAAGYVGTASAYIKAIITFAKLEITLDPEHLALVRTKTTKDGDPVKLTTTVKINFDHGNVNKAMRGMSWGMGTDIAPFPDNGPVNKAEVDWVLYDDQPTYDRAVQFVSPGTPGDGQLKLDESTDTNGQATVNIQTARQAFDLPENVQSFQREATVGVKVSLKGNNFSQDLVDAFGIVAGAATGGPVRAIVNAIPDMLNRTSIFSNKGFLCKITDWTEPVGQGTFDLTITGEGNQAESSGFHKWSINRHATGKLISMLEGKSKAEVLAAHGAGPYQFVIENLHDASVNDSVQNHLTYGDGCDSPPRLHVIDSTLTGPVADINYPYGNGLRGGLLSASIGHEGGSSGRDYMEVKLGTGFSLPCKFRNVTTDYPDETGIEYVDFPIQGSERQSRTSDGSFKGSVDQDRDIDLGGAKGHIHAHLIYNITVKG